MSLLCALAPLGAACVAQPTIDEMPGVSLQPGSAEEPLGSAPAELAAQSSAPASASVYPREATLFGDSYEEWAATWWQWMLAIPADVNPNGEGPCDVDQSGHVFFLAGNWGGTSTRSCTIPTGKAIFVPILIAYRTSCPEIAGGSYTCESATSEDDLHEVAEWMLDQDNSMSLEIDGVAVEGLDEYRAHTATFSMPAPEEGPIGICAGPIQENPCGVPVGTPRNTVSDGHWVMLRPLPPGEHQIHLTGSVPSFGFSLDITYNITVAP